jgi:hypothetical protein
LEYFKNVSTLPVEFNPNVIDDKLGENCALIAAKIGSLRLLKMYWSLNKVDFHLVNNRNENAVQLAIIGQKKMATNQSNHFA